MSFKNILELKFLSIDTSSYESARNEVESRGFLWEDWYYERAVSPKSVVNDYSFWLPKKVDTIETVPVSRIIGQDHMAYLEDNAKGVEPRWITLFYAVSDKWGKTNPEEVRQEIICLNNGSSPVALEKYGDLYFVKEGKHRLVHAKFLKMESLRCRVTEFVLDSESLALYNKLVSLVGPDPLKDQRRFVEVESVKFQWNGLFFTLKWNKATIDAFERQVNQVKRICSNRFNRFLFMLSNILTDNKRVKGFSLDSSTSIPDFRASLIFSLHDRNTSLL